MTKASLALSSHRECLQILHWVDQNYPYLFWRDGQQIPYPHGSFPSLLLAGCQGLDIQHYPTNIPPGGLVGIVSYDYKNQLENLKSSNPAFIDLPETLFFEPELKIKWTDTEAIIEHSRADTIVEEILSTPISDQPHSTIKIYSLTSKKEYLENVRKIKAHIREGDIYEMNYCMGFTGEFESLDPLTLFLQLKENSPMPFSALFKNKGQYLLCASPERFLKRNGEQLIAQPIKGTIRRGATEEEDQALQKHLLNSEKERAENLMIVDLMRNDLSKVAQTGSVEVEELFGIYPFRKVSQMISTVSARQRKAYSFPALLHATFPMGSMTGAPKIRCMELIDQYENFQRTWFSGTMGYCAPDGDFDWNVIIRSLILDQNAGKFFFAAGSAITYDADPEYEYQECMLKAQSIFDIL